MPVAMWHHDVSGGRGAHLLATDDERDLDGPRGEVLERLLQLRSLGSPRSVRKHRLVDWSGERGYGEHGRKCKSFHDATTPRSKPSPDAASWSVQRGVVEQSSVP